MDERILQEGQSIVGIANQKRDQLQNLADSQLGAKSMNDLMENTRKHMIERSILDPLAMPFLAKFGASKTVEALKGAAKRGIKFAGREIRSNAKMVGQGLKDEVGEFRGQLGRDGSATWNEFKESDFGKGIFKFGNTARQMNPEAWEATARDMARNGGDIFRGATETGNRFLNGEHGTLPTADDVRDFFNRTPAQSVQSEQDLFDSRFGGPDATGDSPDQNVIENVGEGMDNWDLRNTPEDQILGTADTSIERGVPTDIDEIARVSSSRNPLQVGGGDFDDWPTNTQFGAPQSQRALPEGHGDARGTDVPEEPVEAELNTSSTVDFNPADEGLANTDLITTGTASETAGTMNSATGNTAGLLGDIGDAAPSESGAMTVFDGLAGLDIVDAPLDAVPGLDIATIGGDLATAALGIGILGAGQVYNALFDKDKKEDLNQGLTGAKSIVSFASQFGTEN